MRRLIRRSARYGYLTSNGDVASGGFGALEHFVTNGVGEGRSPGPGFPSLEFKQVFADEPVWSVDALARMMYGPVEDLWHDIGWIQAASGRRAGGRAGGDDMPDLFALGAATSTAKIAVLAYVFYPDVWEELATRRRRSRRRSTCSSCSWRAIPTIWRRRSARATRRRAS